ncbi:MAG: 5-formyltetrahydrofolate cyclo-ligase [Alkalilacustris sp.]
MTASAAKAALRDRMKTRRAGLEVPAAAPACVLAKILRSHAGRRVAGYWPLPAEADPRPALLAHGGPWCLPVVVGRDKPLIFRDWRPGAELVPGPFGVQQPVGAVCTPQVVVVPLLAFDRRGHRLGYGGGFYDRTLAGLLPRPLAIGFSFADQEVEVVPVEATDAPLDLIVTEDGVIAP